MKTRLISMACCLSLLLGVVSCGKEAKSRQAETSTSDNLNENQLPVIKQLADAVHANDVEKFNRIFDFHKDTNLNLPVGDDNDTLIGIAIRKNHRKIFEYLLDQKIDLELVTHYTPDYGFTPLITAAHYGHYHIVKILMEKLIENQASIDTDDELGNTPLHHAIRKKFDNIAILLIQNGASLTKKGKLGRDALALAQETGSEQTLQYVRNLSKVSQGVVPDQAAIRNFIQKGDREALSRALAKTPTLLSDYDEINPLVVAMEIEDDNSSFLMTKLLLNREANANGPAGAETTPLIAAVKKSRGIVAVLLLQKKANVDALDKSEKTAMYYAVENNDFEMVKLLLGYGARPSFKIRAADGHKVSYNGCSHAHEIKQKQENADAETTAGKIVTWLCSRR